MSVFAPTPTVEQVRVWLRVSEQAMPDEQLQVVVDAEAANQARVCRISPDGLSHDQVAALYRRCARAVAAKGIPLGYQAIDEFGPARLAMFDAEIERLEGPSRRFAFG